MILIQQELQLNTELFLYVKNVSQEAMTVAITLNSQYTKKCTYLLKDEGL